MNTDDNKFRGSDLSYFSSSLKDKWRIIKSKIKENKKTYNYVSYEVLSKEFQKKKLFEQLFLTYKNSYLFFFFLLAISILIMNFIIGISINKAFKDYDKNFSYGKAIPEKTKSILTFDGKKEIVILPDKSEIVVFPNSTLFFDNYLSLEGPKIIFNGSAYIIAKKYQDYPFILDNENFFLILNGVELIIYSFTNACYIYIYKGFALMQLKKNKEIVRIDEKTLLKVEFSGLRVKTFLEKKEIFGLSDLVLYYDNCELREVLKDLEKNYSVKVVCKDYEKLSLKVSGAYLLSSLEEILKELNQKYNVNFELRGYVLFVY